MSITPQVRGVYVMTRIPAALLMLLLSVGLARADYTFQFANSAGTPATNFTVAQGGTIDILVYLFENDTAGLLHLVGLNDAGVRLNTQTATAANVTATTGNPSFDKVRTTTGATAFIKESVKNVPPVTSPANDQSRILIGTFTFTGLSADSSTMVVTSLPNGAGDNVLGDGTVIDSLITNSSATVTVTALPEPRTLLLTISAATIGVSIWGCHRIIKGPPSKSGLRVSSKVYRFIPDGP
jgi:hypothetical protein